MPADVNEVFTKAELPKGNVFLLVLDQRGQLVHAFGSAEAADGPRGQGYPGYEREITKALGKLKFAGKVAEHSLVLPDLSATRSGVPAGVRLFVRRLPAQGSGKPVVEVVPMKAEDWKILAFPEKAREIEAETLRTWLVQLYPPAIRTVDQRKPFQKISGRLKLEPAGADKNGRHALLTGEIRLNKGDDKESAFEGTLQVVLTYRTDAAGVQSVRGVVEGDYLYRIRETQRMPLRVAIESRPEFKLEPGFKLLFNGKTLDGWKEAGLRIEAGDKFEALDRKTEACGGRFKVVEGRLVYDPAATSVIGYRRCIETAQEFGEDVHIKFDFKPGPGSNNDLFLRGTKFDIGLGPTAKLGKYIKEDEWAAFEILVTGDKIEHKIGGKTVRTSTLTDAKATPFKLRSEKGAFEIKNIRVKE